MRLQDLFHVVVVGSRGERDLGLGVRAKVSVNPYVGYAANGGE